MALHDVAVELYGLPPDQFVSARAAAAKEAKAAGNRELATAISGLRKASTAAWAVNLLVRHHPEDLHRLLALGEQLRAAQAALVGEELRALNVSQHQVMAAVIREASALTQADGHRLSDSVATQVESTLRAAMSDPDAAAAVLTGLLTSDLESNGFEPVDVDGAVAVADAPTLVEHAPQRPVLRAVPDPASRTPALTSPPTEGGSTAGARADARAQRAEEARRVETERRRSEAERRRAEAQEDLRLAEHDETAAQAALLAAREQVTALEAREAEVTDQVRRTSEQIAELQELLAGLRQDAQVTAKGLRRTRSVAESAEKAARSASRRTTAARTHLDRM